MSNLAPCTHKEADTHLMICTLDASLRGHWRIKIRTNDTDVIVLALSVVVVLLYDRKSSLLKVNEARQELFCKKSREFDSISPTKAALEQHIRRALILGAKPSCVSPHFLALQTGDGSIKHVAGHRIG
ncbi:unnamed protein product [Porites lobata]|uniref:Uncharacterized protein n=1 Tax=Porites lobata TaxID=104759 RepID=A0ABN8PDL3_9CNID|nr:unnamed protein product [Porites lobata]